MASARSVGRSAADPLWRARPKITDQIIEAMRSDIASGKFTRGERLPNERELARQFGVSQPTIREALRALDAMGFLDVRHGSGAFATGNGDRILAISLETLLQLERVGIREVLDVRAALGVSAVSRAAREATEAEIDRIAYVAQVLEKVRDEKDVTVIAEHVVWFQCAVSAASHNPLQFAIESFLIRLLVKFQLTAKKRAGIRFWRKWTLQFADERSRLVHALRDRDEREATTAMEAYLAEQYELFSSDRDIARLRLSDPTAVQTIASIMLEIPDLSADVDRSSRNEGPAPAGAAREDLEASKEVDQASAPRGKQARRRGPST